MADGFDGFYAGMYEYFSVFSPCDALSFQRQMVGDHGDELRIGRFSLAGIDRIAELLLQRVEVAAIPRDLNGVADGALHAGGGGAELLGHGGVQHLGHRVDDLHVVDRENDRLAEVLVALDVGGDAEADLQPFS